MFRVVYPSIFSENGDGSYTVSFPDLPGCITYGDDQADALMMANDAACGWILDEIEDGKKIPKPSAVAHLHLQKNETISLMVLDIDTYASKYGDKAVKKNTTIPAWLNTFGETIHANYSQLLTDSLKQLYLQYCEFK